VRRRDRVDGELPEEKTLMQANDAQARFHGTAVRVNKFKRHVLRLCHALTPPCDASVGTFLAKTNAWESFG
jgi:hypothetical protein